MLLTIATLVAGCFVICVAVLALASFTDGRRKASVMVKSASARRPFQIGRRP